MTLNVECIEVIIDDYNLLCPWALSFLVWAMQAYQEIEQRLVSETVFSQYMYKTLPSCNHLWAFKKQFCCQMALSGTVNANRHDLSATPDLPLWANLCTSHTC